MSEPEPRPSTAPTGLMAPFLVGAGLLYLGLGVTLAVVYALGGVQSSLFPTGWLFPAVLVITGMLMTLRRRFDVVATLWGGFSVAVYTLGALIYLNALDHGLDDAAAFDATLIVAGLGLLVVVLRPAFRS